MGVRCSWAPPSSCLPLICGLLRYNIGILATIFVSPGFIKSLHDPSAAKQGLITAIYYLGTWTSYVFLAGPASDRFGRRWATFIGALVVCIGAALQAGASGSGALAMMIIGRIICGLGTAVTSTAVPLYQRFISVAPFELVEWVRILADYCHS